jgi:UDP-glucose 4-epimerase
MRVLITGASGYVGRAVVRQLLDNGHVPRLLVHSTKIDAPEGTDLVRGDLLDRSSLALATANTDAVIHLAALVRVRESFEQPLRYYEVNVGGTLNVLNVLAAAHGHVESPPRLVFTSTAGVYGTPQRQPIDEDHPRAPQNPYASSKLAAEDAVAWAAKAGQVGAATLRIFNAAGALLPHGDTDDSRLITRMIGAAAGRIERVDVFGDGSAVRDFVHVEDIARAAVLALENCRVGEHDVFNVGATPASVRDVIDTVHRVTGREPASRQHPAHPGEVRELRADTTRLRKILGWRPERSALEDLVRDQWEFERAR